MIDPSKLPTAVIHWPSIMTVPAIVTVDELTDGYAIARNYGKLRLTDLYDIENEQKVNELYNRFRACREEYIAFPSIVG